jgi:hypothetical protein
MSEFENIYPQEFQGLRTLGKYPNLSEFYLQDVRKRLIPHLTYLFIFIKVSESVRIRLEKKKLLKEIATFG